MLKTASKRENKKTLLGAQDLNWCLKRPKRAICRGSDFFSVKAVFLKGMHLEKGNTVHVYCPRLQGMRCHGDRRGYSGMLEQQ